VRRGVRTFEDFHTPQAHTMTMNYSFGERYWRTATLCEAVCNAIIRDDHRSMNASAFVPIAPRANILGDNSIHISVLRFSGF
jgi:hypothetical protein